MVEAGRVSPRVLQVRVWPSAGAGCGEGEFQDEGAGHRLHY